MSDVSRRRASDLAPTTRRRYANTDDAETERVVKSYTVAEVERFRHSMRDDRLYACWLLSCDGLRRSEVVGLRWLAIGGDVLPVRRGRVAVGGETVAGAPKSRRSRRE